MRIKAENAIGSEKNINVIVDYVKQEISCQFFQNIIWNIILKSILTSTLLFLNQNISFLIYIYNSLIHTVLLYQDMKLDTVSSLNGHRQV